MARKRPRSFCQKCRWQVTHKHAYAFDPTKSEWADYAAVQAWCGNPSGNELTRNSQGKSRSQSSHLAEPLWTDPGLMSGISVRELISMGREMNCRTFSQKPSHARKKPPPENFLESTELTTCTVVFDMIVFCRLCLCCLRTSSFFVVVLPLIL